jgi:hypothetical protein
VYQSGSIGNREGRVASEEGGGEEDIAARRIPENIWVTYLRYLGEMTRKINSGASARHELLSLLFFKCDEG